MNLKKKLNDWVEKTFITGEQRDKIAAYEEEKDGAAKWLYYGFITIAGFAIGIGIISIIAHNWDEIPDGVKLAVGMIMLVAFAAAYYWFKIKDHGGFAELFMFLLFMGCLAYIGLVAQVYNLYDMPHRGFLFWAVITTPLALYSTVAFLPFVWVLAISTTLSIELMQYDFMEKLMKKLIVGMDNRLVCIYMLGLLFSYVIWMLGVRLFKKFDPLKRAFSFYYGLGFVISLISIEVLGRVIGEIFYELRYMLGMKGDVADAGMNYTFLGLMLALMIAAWFVVPKDDKRLWRVCLGSFYFLMILTLVTAPVKDIYFACVTIIVLAYISVYYALHHRKYLFNFFTFLIGVRIIVLYIEKFGSNLLDQGVALISSGIIAIIVTAAWYKYKDRLDRAIRSTIG